MPRNSAAQNVIRILNIEQGITNRRSKLVFFVPRQIQGVGAGDDVSGVSGSVIGGGAVCAPARKSIPRSHRIIVGHAVDDGARAVTGQIYLENDALCGLAPFPVPNIRELSGVPPHSTKLPDFGAGGAKK